MSFVSSAYPDDYTIAMVLLLLKKLFLDHENKRITDLSQIFNMLVKYYRSGNNGGLKIKRNYNLALMQGFKYDISEGKKFKVISAHFKASPVYA